MKLFNMAVWLTSGLVLLVSTSYFYGSQQNQQQPTPTHVHLNQTHMTVTPTTTTATANDSTTIRKLTPPEDFFFNIQPQFPLHTYPNVPGHLSSNSLVPVCTTRNVTMPASPKCCSCGALSISPIPCPIPVLVLPKVGLGAKTDQRPRLSQHR